MPQRVALVLRTAPCNWTLLIAAWAVCAAHLVACMLLLLDLVAGLLPALGPAFNVMAFLSRAGRLIEGVLVDAVAVAYRRRWLSACLFCGPKGVRVRLAKPPWWAWWAAYAALVGCLARLGALVAVGFGMSGDRRQFRWMG